MKKLFIALSLCACAFSSFAHQVPKKQLPVGEKVVDIKVVGDNSKGWTFGENIYVVTRPMEREEIAECYKVYRAGADLFNKVQICERKE